jgi:hypothetical protein
MITFISVIQYSLGSLKRLKNMSQKNNVRHRSNCQVAIETTATLTAGSKPNVPSPKRKEQAKQTLYLNRI